MGESLKGLGYGKRRLIGEIIKNTWGVEDPYEKKLDLNEILYLIQEMEEEEGKKHLQETYSIKRGFNVFRMFAQHLLYRNLANYDSMVLMTSEKGTGKSSAAIMLARQWCQLLGIRFDPNRHLAYTNRDVMEKIDMLNKFEPLVADESVRFASSADWAKADSKELRKKIAEVRTKHLLFILCFPLKIYKMEKNYLESFVNYWCLTGDTKIITRDVNGIIRNTPIKNINKFNPEILSYNIKTKEYEFKKYDKKIKTKKDAEVFELELENGLKIKCTEDHPFLTQRGWVRLKDLTHDDKIEVKTKTCKFCKEKFIPKKQQQIYCCKKCNDAFNIRTYRQKEYNKKYRELNREDNKKRCSERYYNNREDCLKTAKIYRTKNKDKINMYAKNYRNNNIELLRQRDKKYRENNYEHYRKCKQKNWKKYRENNINFKLRENLRNAMRRVLKYQQTKKTHPIFKYLGCSVEEFKEYISKQFKPGMSWKNWGKDSWHIDHIKPCSHFDLTKESERYKCFNYNNQQPMWASENWSKGDRYVG